MYHHSSLSPSWEFMRNKGGENEENNYDMYYRAFALNVQAQPVKTLKLSDKELLDKIKGGWAGQTIGVVFEHLQSLSSRELIFKITSQSPWRKVT